MLYDEKTAIKTAELLIQIGAVTFRFNPPYTFTSGLKSPIYLDNRLVMSYPLIREKIVSFYIKIIKEKIGLKNIDYISATATAAIPQGAWVAQKLKVPMVFVRPTTKSYGKGNKIEGFLRKTAKVVIIEDHISTAESVVGNADSIRASGGKVAYCVSTTTYETKLSSEQLLKNKIQLISLTTGKVIINTASKMKLLTDTEKKSIDIWYQDPPNWAKKMGLE